jgi:putative ABC transport system permease protein
MFKAAIKSLLAHKTRLSLSVLAIVLGVAFIAGTYIYTDTSNAAFDGIFDEAFTGIDVVISGESDFSLGQGVFFEEELVNDVAAVPGVARVEPTVNGFGVQVLDREGEPIGGGGPPQLSDYLPTDLDRAGGFVLRDGRPPSGPDEMALDANTAELGEYAIGDSVTVVSQAGPAAEYELVGIVGFGDADNLGGATFALFDLPTAQAVIGQEGMITGAYAIAEDGTDTEALIMEVQTILPENAVAQSGQDAAAAEAADLQEALSFFGTFLLVFAFIALFVGTFLIYNTFQFVVAQRMRELALLRAIGATRSQVVRTVLLEAVLLGVIGSILGIVAGAGLAIGLRASSSPSGRRSCRPSRRRACLRSLRCGPRRLDRNAVRSPCGRSSAPPSSCSAGCRFSGDSPATSRTRRQRLVPWARVRCCSSSGPTS